MENELTIDELCNMLWIVIVAGHETTVHLLGNAVVTLCTHPEQRAKALAEDRCRGGNAAVQVICRRRPHRTPIRSISTTTIGTSWRSVAARTSASVRHSPDSRAA
ncbi:hypothetical protein AB0H00_25690 [Nocardia sp. NPDC023852]|uniref:hypothetical protein n=1 Tax=Nocardia sp. NPDC023852 TaxID=3154697 RepID=UPI00340CB0C8